MTPEPFRRLPTTDLYFLGPLALLRAEGHGARARPAGRHVYVVGRTAVVSRYADAGELARLTRLGFERLVYIADDDFVAGGEDPALPPRYRAFLQGFGRTEWQRLRDRADAVVVPGPALAEAYGSKSRIMHPFWPAPAGSLDHFEGREAFHIAYLGTKSHRGDLETMRPALEAVLDRRPDVRLTLFWGRDLPPWLIGRSNVRSLPVLPWWLYRRVLPRLRFHLTLYPLRPSAFNAARSANKLFEATVVGAASLMSPLPVLTDAAGAGLADAFVGGGADEWTARIMADVDDRRRVLDRAARAAERVRRLDVAGQAVVLWRSLLGG